MLRLTFWSVDIQLFQAIGWTGCPSSTESLLHICQQSFGPIHQSGSKQEIETKQYVQQEKFNTRIINCNKIISIGYTEIYMV